MNFILKTAPIKENELVSFCFISKFLARASYHKLYVMVQVPHVLKDISFGLSYNKL